MTRGGGGVSALSGVSALPGLSALSGVSALLGLSALPGLSAPGPVISLGCHTGGYPQGCGDGAGPGRPPRLPGLAGLKEHFHSGYPYPARGPALPLGSQANPGVHRHPWGSREFSWSGQLPAIRQAPPLHSE